MKIAQRTVEQTEALDFCRSILLQYNIDFKDEDILCESHLSEFVFKRALISIILRHEGKTFKKIGQILNRNHATIINLVSNYSVREHNYTRRFCEIQKDLKLKTTKFTLNEQIKFHQEKIRQLTQKLEAL